MELAGDGGRISGDVCFVQMTGESVEYRERIDGDCREGEWYGL